VIILMLQRALQKFRRSDGGTSTIEFAILAPVLIYLAVGMIDVGRYTYYSILAANAARAGAQYGAQDLAHVEQYTAIQAAVLADGQSLAWTPITANCMYAVNNGTLTKCPSSGGSTITSGTVYYSQVSTTGTFTTLFQYPGIPKQVVVTGSSTMRVANQ
jgi:Flp pilus assembly protein TadG